MLKPNIALGPNTLLATHVAYAICYVSFANAMHKTASMYTFIAPVILILRLKVHRVAADLCIAAHSTAAALYRSTADPH